MTRPAPVAIDTLKTFEDLQEAGLEPEAARAVVEAIAKAHANRAVTIADLREMMHQLDLRICEVDRKIELQETRNRVGISAIRKEGRAIQAEVRSGRSGLTLTLILLFGLALVLGALWDRYATGIWALLASIVP